jgi:nitrogenase molybdenum-iron protein alpha/beta subunit
VAIIGDYNIGGDAWATRILLEEMGLRVVSQWSGDGTMAEMMNTPKVKLNLLHCYRSMNYISRTWKKIRHSLPGIQLLRPDQDHRIPAQDRGLLRLHHQGKDRPSSPATSR